MMYANKQTYGVVVFCLNYNIVPSKSRTLTPQRATEAKVLVQTLRPSDIIKPGGGRERERSKTRGERF